MNKTLFLLFLSAIISVSAYPAGIIKKSIPDRLVVLTFDDASASHYNIVMPLLKKYNFGGTFYICEFPPCFPDTTKFMTWDKIAELNREGLEVGNHTKSHALLTKISQSQIIEELDYIDNKCKEYGIPKPETFAYPAYYRDSASIATLREHGVKLARIGGDMHYDPTKDHPLLVPSASITSVSDKEIQELIDTATDGKILVITLHGVPDIQHPHVSIDVERFVRLLDYLQKQNCTVISMSGLLKYIDIEKAFKKLDTLE